MAGEAPAIQQARTDANTKWPNRNKKSDGTWGDKKHQERASDHNTGDAIDITHDPASGADGDKIAAIAIRDPRVKYVIWNRRMYTPGTGGWVPYKHRDKMPHDKHVHISVKKAARAETTSWGWLKDEPAPSINVPGESTFEDAYRPPAPPKKKKKKAAPKANPGAKGKVAGRKIIVGEHSVVLGSAQHQAAHVESPHTGGGRIAKGSPTVFVGKKMLAFARIGDPTTDNLNVVTGKETVFIG
ncbi:hypothetical protein [Chondromyces apiculatus]|uniref:ARB-07466-like C-terminal domain-containing protein n=1 Tax=Chondromyces apiculatus DSM 436 TaxID=1192034 RepID=A0A017TIR8_9BACT|nr:hypothetical protein [Chondromyces apiculatus]EYF08797.1 Hypothetical protein CAP_2658 [Chondromyces apiculatus DSM 436]